MAVILHNLQSDGDHRNSRDGIGDSFEAVQLAIDAAVQGIAYKEECGVQGRLRHAQEYLEENKADKAVFHASSDATDQECDDCPEVFSVNIDLIRLQHESAMSIYMDALKARGTDYSSIEPTPIPDASQDTKNLIADNALNAVVRDIISTIPQGSVQEDGDEFIFGITYLEDMLGTDAGLAAAQEVVDRQKSIENSKLSSAAARKATNAKKHVDDKLTESNYDSELKEFASSMFWNDYAVMFAPYKEEVETTKLSKAGKLRADRRMMWAFQNIHPLNHFYSPSTTYADMGDYEGDVVFMSKNDLRSIGRSKGADEATIKDVVDNFEDHKVMHGIHSYDEHLYSDLNQIIPCIRIFIRLCTDDAKELYKESDLDIKQSSHMVEMLIASDHKLLYKSLYPRHLNFSPYRKMSFNMPTHSNLSAGRGLYSLCRTGQEIVDNSLVALLRQISEGNKYILEVNDDKVAEPDELESDLEADRPLIRTKGTGSYAAYGGNDRAIHVTTVPDAIGKFVDTLLTGISLVEKVGLSAFALGQGNFPNVRSTGQTAILQVNGNKRFAKVLTDQEFYVESPVIKYIWMTESMETGDTSIIVDADVRVTSYSGFLQKQNESDRVGLFMQNIVGFLNARTALEGQGTDVGFYDSLLKQYVEASGYDASALDIGSEQTEIGELASVVDVVEQPLEQLDGRNNVDVDTINQVI